MFFCLFCVLGESWNRDAWCVCVLLLLLLSSRALKRSWSPNASKSLKVILNYIKKSTPFWNYIFPWCVCVCMWGCVGVDDMLPPSLSSSLRGSPSLTLLSHFTVSHSKLPHIKRAMTSNDKQVASHQVACHCSLSRCTFHCTANLFAFALICVYSSDPYPSFHP